MSPNVAIRYDLGVKRPIGIVFKKTLLIQKQKNANLIISLSDPTNVEEYYMRHYKLFGTHSSSESISICHGRSDQLIFVLCVRLYSTTGRGSSIGSEFAWHASGPEFDPHVRHILSWRLGHENISMAISLFRWFKKSSCQLLAKECALSTGKLPRRLVQEQCG